MGLFRGLERFRTFITEALERIYERVGFVAAPPEVLRPEITVETRIFTVSFNWAWPSGAAGEPAITVEVEAPADWPESAIIQLAIEEAERMLPATGSTLTFATVS